MFRSRAAFLQDYRLLKLHMEVFGLAITSNRLAVSCQARFVKQLAFCKWASADRVGLLQAALAVYLVRGWVSMPAALVTFAHAWVGAEFTQLLQKTTGLSTGLDSGSEVVMKQTNMTRHVDVGALVK